MARRIIIVPSEIPGGLDAVPCEHFGQCAVFTIVTLEDNTISSVEAIDNVQSGCRNCFNTISFLREKGMSELLVRKIGIFPLRILDSIGIPIHYIGREGTVEAAVRSFLQGQLKDFDINDTCSGECEH